MSVSDSNKLLLWITEHGLHRGGSMSQELRRADLRRRHRGDPRARQFLSLLAAKGVDRQKIRAVLEGEEEPYVDVFDLHCRWVLAADDYWQDQKRQERIIKLSGELVRWRGIFKQIQASPLFLKSFKDTCKEEFSFLESTLNDLRENESFPKADLSKRLFDPRGQRKGDEWARQRHWSDVLRSLLPLWHNASHTNYQAFNDIAKLFSLYFPPFPNDPNLVKRRYYHSVHKHRTT